LEKNRFRDLDPKKEKWVIVKERESRFYFEFQPKAKKERIQRKEKI